MSEIKEIVGNTTATPAPCPDWNQNDPNKGGYIKNKPDNLAPYDYVDDHIEEAITSLREDLDELKLDKTGGTIDGSLIITEDLTIKGTTYTHESQTMRVDDNIVELNSNKMDNSKYLSGIVINKGMKGERDRGTYGIVYDPSDDTVKLGLGKTDGGEFYFNDGEGAPVAIRDDSSRLDHGSIMIFDANTNKLVNSGYTMDTFKQWVRDYVESYISTMLIKKETGGLEINANGKAVVTENSDGSKNITIGG